MATTSSTIVKLLCLAIIAMAAVYGPVTEAVGCGDVGRYMGPCLSYLRNGGPMPGGCCPGVKSLAGAAKTRADRQTICGCLKAAAGGVQPGLAAGLPGRCGVSVPYKISPNTDCSKIT